eukprot:359710-Chlamydomonas_euryale.AAC.7
MSCGGCTPAWRMGQGGYPHEFSLEPSVQVAVLPGCLSCYLTRREYKRGWGGEEAGNWRLHHCLCRRAGRAARPAGKAGSGEALDVWTGGSVWAWKG